MSYKRCTVILSIAICFLMHMMGCSYLQPASKGAVYPAISQTAEEIDFKFSIAGADTNMMQSLARGPLWGNPYRWDIVPNYDTHIQMLRPCTYYERHNTKPVNANRWWCWDKSIRGLRKYNAGDDFEHVVVNHPEWIWIIGNEPDNETQDNLTPKEYSEFFGWIAKTVANQIIRNVSGEIPKLVICQTIANPNYCDAVYFTLQEMVHRGEWPDWPQEVKIKDVIWAIAVHNYIDGRYSLTEEDLEAAMTEWIEDLEWFAHWAKSVDDGALADKPLWVTEFGALQAFCPRKLELREGMDRKNGVECPATAKRGNGKMNDDYVFYGRNEREGLWGMQQKMIEYFLNQNENYGQNQGDWEAAWWFVSRMGDWDKDGECDQTAWLYGEDVQCTLKIDTLSRAGITFKNIINCITENSACP